MANLEIAKIKNEGSGFNYTFKSEGLDARADFDPATGMGKVRLNTVENMAAALQTIIDTFVEDARTWQTNPVIPLHIDIATGQFDTQLAEVADRFGLKGPIPADESGSEGLLYRAEIPLAR